MYGFPRRLALAAVVLATLVLTGCEGGTETNGLEKKSAAEVQEEASAALKAAKSVHVTGTGINDGKPVDLDLQIQGTSSSGTLTLSGARFEITRLGANTYLKADRRALAVLGAPTATQRLGADRWLKARGAADDVVAGFLARRSRRPADRPGQPPRSDRRADDPRRPGGRRDRPKGRVEALRGEHRGRLPAARGQERPGRWADRFHRVRRGFHITAPPHAVEISKLRLESGPMSGEDLLWLESISAMHRRIDKALLESGPDLTRSVMVSLVETVRGCSRELAKGGSPSARLQPVYTLVKSATD